MSEHAERKSPEQIADAAIFSAFGQSEDPGTVTLSIEILRKTVAAAIREDRAIRAARPDAEHVTPVPETGERP